MDKEELINLLKSLNLNVNDYYVLSGGSLLIQGLKEKTHDLDLIINEKALKHLQENFNVIQEGENKFTIGDHIECFLESSEDILNNRVIVNNYSCQSLSSVYSLKKRLNRPKDQIDIKRLEKELKL